MRIALFAALCLASSASLAGDEALIALFDRDGPGITHGVAITSANDQPASPSEEPIPPEEDKLRDLLSPPPHPLIVTAIDFGGTDVLYLDAEGSLIGTMGENGEFVLSEEQRFKEEQQAQIRELERRQAEEDRGTPVEEE